MTAGLIPATRQVKTLAEAMDNPAAPAPSLAESIAAAQAWWREAGVDFAYIDEPLGWFAEPEDEAKTAPTPRPTPKAEPEPAPLPAIGGDRANWPQNLADFRQWWLKEPSLDQGGTSPRIAPRGEADAPLMMLVAMPEESDRDTLLQGAEGRLLASLAVAMGLTPDAVYLATALPRHTPMPDWGKLGAQGYGEVLLHHIHLANPRRLMVFGRDVLPLLRHDPTQAAPFTGELTIQGRQLPLLASYAPTRLLGNGRWRGQLWRRWLDWSQGNTGGDLY